MPEKIAGLPAHPLIIHLPLVLGPVVGVLALLLLAPALRDRLLLPTAVLGVVFAASTVAAVISGEAFLATLKLGDAIQAHQESAETLRLLALILAAALIGFAITRNRLPKIASGSLALVVAALGVATVGFTVQTGHEGATLVWKQRFDAAEQRQDTTPAPAASRSDDDGSAPNGLAGGSDAAEAHKMSPEEHGAMQGR